LPETDPDRLAGIGISNEHRRFVTDPMVNSETVVGLSTFLEIKVQITDERLLN
jgi:hypothetical protein